MDKDNELGMNEEYMPDLYELEDENGDKQSFELLDVMEYEGEKYYALTPYYSEEEIEKMLDDSGEVVILRSEFDENNDEILASIDDDEEYEKIGEIFMKRMRMSAAAAMLTVMVSISADLGSENV